MKSKLLLSAISFLKIGTIGFGGGSSLIPVVEKEIVQNKKYISEKDYTEHVIVSNITPGALPVKLCAAAGMQIAGYIGMLTGALAVALPGSLGTVLILSFLSVLSGGFLNQVTYASFGISAFIIFILISYIRRVISDSAKAGFKKQAVVIMLVSAALTFGKEIREVLANITGINLPEFLKRPVLDIATVDLMLLVFFVIFFTGGKFIKWRVYTTGILGIFFLLVSSKSQIINIPYLKTIVTITMIILSVYYAIHDTRAEGANSVVKINYKIVLLQIACFILPILVLLIPNIILKDGSINYTLQGIISTVTSFGGGEAYLTVADGLFVSSNIVSPEEFYSYIVPVANALPGPILVKILSGIGYFIGSNEGGLLAGYLLSALGFVIGVGATCIVFVIVHMVYKAFSEIEVFVTLKKWILPAICGLLISTILSMFHEMFKITAEKGISGFISAIIAAMVIIGAEQLHKRLHIHDVILIILSGAVSLFMLNVI